MSNTLRQYRVCKERCDHRFSSTPANVCIVQLDSDGLNGSLGSACSSWSAGSKPKPLDRPYAYRSHRSSLRGRCRGSWPTRFGVLRCSSRKGGSSTTQYLCHASDPLASPNIWWIILVCSPGTLVRLRPWAPRRCTSTNLQIRTPGV